MKVNVYLTLLTMVLLKLNKIATIKNMPEVGSHFPWAMLTLLLQLWNVIISYDGGRLRKDVHDIDDDGVWNYLRVMQTSNRKKVPRCQPNKGKKDMQQYWGRNGIHLSSSKILSIW